ncbi:hypothetical protein [Parvibaculum sp.]|uniref:hypothetical protein n=2 Tax=Parvibaculum sp. TaxID=2024848 RepID=UPI002FDA026B
MLTWKHWAGLALCSLIFASCGGRVANIAPEQRSVDAVLSCDHLSGELAVNNKKIDELSGERQTANDHNAGKIAGAVLVPTYILFLDLSDTERREAEALVARNDELERLIAARSCGGSGNTVVAAEAASAGTEVNGTAGNAP